MEANMDTRTLRHRFWLELAAAGVAFVMIILTAVIPNWIELFFGLDPDAGSGGMEWLITAAPVGLFLGFGLLARVEFRRARNA
jgi:hypothetical protein